MRQDTESNQERLSPPGSSRWVNGGLTGLARRRRFDQVLELECQRIRRSDSACSLILLDIDPFKHFNDVHGHVGDDGYLQQVGALIASQVTQATEVAARYGTEEFAIVLPDTDAAGATALAERIRAGIADLVMPQTAASAADQVTVSRGALISGVAQEGCHAFGGDHGQRPSQTWDLK